MRSFITDFSTLIGILVALVLLLLAILLGGNVAAFLDIPSILIVVLGTFFLTLASSSFSEMMQAQLVVFRTLYYESNQPKKVTQVILGFADISRKKGFLALQQVEGYDKLHPFFRKGMDMIIDGVTPDETARILRAEIDAKMERHFNTTSLLRKSADVAPAMGLIGTLIGLVQMLGNLSDPSSIGPAMAVALLTTFYGAGLAFVVFGPLAGKLERNSAHESLILNMFVQGILSIGKKENPRRLEMMLNAMVPPASRIRFFV